MRGDPVHEVVDRVLASPRLLGQLRAPEALDRPAEPPVLLVQKGEVGAPPLSVDETGLTKKLLPLTGNAPRFSPVSMRREAYFQ
ncbi:MAG: hypothetical protein ABI968_01115 [Acidobacteriota bacterium]